MAPPPSSGEGQENEPSTTGQPQANGSSDSKGQSVMHKDALGIDSSTSAKKLKPPRPETIEACPRCGSNDTKFCYYNNYNVKQPRFFCKVSHHCGQKTLHKRAVILMLNVDQ